MDMFYVLDREDRIVGVGGGWNEFAHENRSPEASAAHVVGEPLTSFIDGVETIQFLQQIFFACRSRDVSFSMLCRCDGPFVKRLYRMEVLPQENQGLMIRHRQLDRVRFKPGSKLIDLDPYRDGNRCSVCNRFEIDGDWVDTFTTHAQKDFVKSYSVCPKCRADSIQNSSANSANETNLIEFPKRSASG